MTETDLRYLAALELFNREKFFECHDALEEIWLEDFGSDHLFYQGLIQAAVGFHHVAGGKLGAGRTMMSKALEKLAPYPGDHRGIGLEVLRREVHEWKRLLDEAIRTGTGPPGCPFPKISFTRDAFPDA